MKLEEQVVSLKLAKKLKELGVPQESYFWWNYVVSSSIELGETEATRKNFWQLLPSHWESERATYCSAFTNAELGELLPECYITERRLNGEWECSQTYTTTYQGQKAKVFRDNPVASFANTEADARAKMLIYLIENNLITL